LDTTRTVAEIVGEGRDYIELNGRKKHVIAYLTDFLFSAKRARTRVSALSGGERNRVILARLFTQAANLLILDEPTNDLDVETLEALEQRLLDYSGTLIAVSHDRHFLDAVVTSTLVFEDDGIVRRHAGAYSDWARLKRELAQGDEGVGRPASKAGARRVRKSSTKLSYQLKRELDALPGRIEQLETDIESLQREIGAPAFYKQAHAVTEERLARLAELDDALRALMDRWAELEALANAS
jgi:ATP-binding cassette subfamily F protein uup